MKFHQILKGTRWIYASNNIRVKVNKIDTCKLVLQDGWTLYLHEVLYILDIWQSSISVLVRYNLNFSGNFIKIYNSTIFYRFGIILNGFVVLGTFYYDNDNVNFSLFVTPRSMDVDVDTWQAISGHRLGHEGLLRPITKLELFIYEHFLVRKTIRKLFGKAIRVELPLQIINLDIYGLMNVKT